MQIRTVLNVIAVIIIIAFGFIGVTVGVYIGKTRAAPLWKHISVQDKRWTYAYDVVTFDRGKRWYVAILQEDGRIDILGEAETPFPELLDRLAQQQRWSGDQVYDTKKPLRTPM